MQAFRQITNVKDNMLRILLPDDFKVDKVEVIVLPIDEHEEKPALKNSEKFSGAISKETAEKMHNHLKILQSEWERDIC